MAKQETFENIVIDALFNAYINEEIEGLKPVGFDDSADIDAEFEEFEKRMMMNLDAINHLFSLKSSYGYLCEQRGFICGVKLGAALMRGMEVKV